MEKQFLTLQELAEFLAVNEMTIRRLVHRKELPFYRVGKVYRFRVSDIEAWLGKHRQGPKLQNKGKDHGEEHDRQGN